MILSLLVYLIPSILAFTLPMAVLMGLLAGLSRMSSDTEITAFKTLGISYKRLLKPVLVFSFLGWITASFLTLYFAPWANYKWVQIISRSVITKVQLRINPREFNESISNTVLYIQDISRENEWKNIFVHFSDPPDEPRIIFADRGHLNFYPEEKRAILELFDGSVHSYPSQEPEKYRVTSFKSFEEEIDVENQFSSISEKKRVREKDIKELIRDVQIIKSKTDKFSDPNVDSIQLWRQKRDYVSHWVEIHKKFALPFVCFIFAFLGISLGATTKKGGRTSGFTISLAIILIYYILITAGEQIAMEGRLSPFIGIWGPNILLLMGGLYFFIKSLRESPFFSGFLRFFRREKDILPSEKKKAIRNRPRFSLRFPNILDRYIIKKFFAIFSLVFFGLLAISIIVAFFERIDTIYEHEKPISLFFKYIWYQIPEFVHFILPVGALTTTLLSLGFLTKFNEITAMKACGISIYRIILPLLLLACLISFFSFYLQENILPYSNKKAEETWNNITDIPPRTYNRLDRRWVMGKERNRIYHYRYYDPIASNFSQISIYDIDPESWNLKSRIYSEKGFLSEGIMSLTNCWYREFDIKKPVKFEEKEQIDLTLAEEKDYFIREWKEPDQMNYGELREYIAGIEERGFETVRFKVDLDFKISFPLTSLVMVLLGIPFAFSMGKKGALVGIGLSIAIAMVYWGGIGIFRSLGYVNYLNSFLAAWAPNLIFGLAGLYMLFTLRT